MLISGKIKLYRFTVPEGLNMQEIADLAQAGGFCTRSRFSVFMQRDRLYK